MRQIQLKDQKALDNITFVICKTENGFNQLVDAIFRGIILVVTLVLEWVEQPPAVAVDLPIAVNK